MIAIIIGIPLKYIPIIIMIITNTVKLHHNN